MTLITSRHARLTALLAHNDADARGGRGNGERRRERHHRGGARHTRAETT